MRYSPKRGSQIFPPTGDSSWALYIPPLAEHLQDNTDITRVSVCCFFSLYLSKYKKRYVVCSSVVPLIKTHFYPVNKLSQMISKFIYALVLIAGTILYQSTLAVSFADKLNNKYGHIFNLIKLLTLLRNN